MKKIYLSLLIVVIFLLSGCSYISYKDYYTNPADYEKISLLSGFGYESGEVLEIFPKTIDDLNVENFFCRYDQQLPLGEGIQLILQVNYDKESYKKEIDRIKSITYACDDYFCESDLSFNAKYLCNDGISEYAAFDELNFSIYYIYLQYIPKNEIEFEHRFLPDDYSGYGELDTDKK